MTKIWFVPFVLIALQACTSQPKTAAEYWYGQGERFGSRGGQYDNDVLADLKEKVSFDQVAYESGYKAGKEIYCDPFKAFEKGIAGTRYTNQCDGQPQEVMIKAEWQRGWDAFLGGDFYKY
ncbi:DUF2799 domain-containing protein [Vibrio sinaloensis]|uniref:DUF2799 domain-containing protein n=1 Tax=Photobacterium sp. (strain ATCC 43367) TaxID=379097 RepID=UPI002F3FFE08